MPFTRSPFTCTSGRPFRALKKPIKGSKSVERGYFLLMRAVLLAALAAGVLAANDDGHRGGKPLTAPCPPRCSIPRTQTCRSFPARCC